ncbi:MAG: phosphodiester glycosidase family protein [Rhodobacteraceae bacterium]|nr:phosphodiester glycosidase family protein [Paracoccaceae bacterium]
MIRTALALLALLCTGTAQAVECHDTVYDTLSYTICSLAPDDDIRLFLNGANASPLGSFRAVEAAHIGQSLLFAMNAGMYQPDRSPVGLYIEGGVEQHRLITSDGPGNFGLLPNGVLCFGSDAPRVYETLAYRSAAPTCRYATQSGPMLVIDGALHPRFLAHSTSYYYRNGVGTGGGQTVFAISNQPVNFHQFGRLFRDHLGLDQALFLDGNISRLHAPSLGRSDLGFTMGPIIGVLSTVDPSAAGD